MAIPFWDDHITSSLVKQGYDGLELEETLRFSYIPQKIFNFLLNFTLSLIFIKTFLWHEGNGFRSLVP